MSTNQEPLTEQMNALGHRGRPELEGAEVAR
jgi:hypothetical protein